MERLKAGRGDGCLTPHALWVHVLTGGAVQPVAHIALQLSEAALTWYPRTRCLSKCVPAGDLTGSYSPEQLIGLRSAECLILFISPEEALG